MAEVVRFPFRNEKLICLAERYLWDVSYRPRRVGMAILLRYRTMGLPWDLSVGHLAVAANSPTRRANGSVRPSSHRSKRPAGSRFVSEDDGQP